MEIGNKFLVALVFGIFYQHLTVADDGVQGCAQLMTQVGQEGSLGPDPVESPTRWTLRDMGRSLNISIQGFMSCFAHDTPCFSKSA